MDRYHIWYSKGSLGRSCRWHQCVNFILSVTLDKYVRHLVGKILIKYCCYSLQVRNCNSDCIKELTYSSEVNM